MSNHECPDCGWDLRYQADMGSPGVGQVWECTNCALTFVVIGKRIIDPRAIDRSEPPPWELTIGDVI